jgi:phosphate transport system protein
VGNRFLFSEELNQLRHNILAMSTRVEENLGKALAALRTSNAELAKEVSADDAEVDALQRKIEDDAATVIATQQPVARDLLELVAIFKITGNIERVGDHAVHLSKAAKKLAKRGDSPFRAQKHLEKMA